jgi:hypothetical protein
MPTGIILAGPGQQISHDSMTYIAKMLEVREHDPVVDKVTDSKLLPPGYGLTYNEPYVGAIYAVQLNVASEFDSPSQFSDTNIAVTANEYGVQTLIPELANEMVKEDLFAIAGRLMGRAMAYKLDQTGITQMQSFGGVLGGGTATLVAGHISAASATIRAGLAQAGATPRQGARPTGDPATGPLYCVIHEYQYRALAAQMSGLFSGSNDGPIGTTPPTMDRGANRVGLTPQQQAWYEQHYRGATIDGVKVLTDNNIPISANAAKGWVAARDAVIHLHFSSPMTYITRTVDGRARRITSTDKWGWGERADVWGVVLNCAAVTPTT